MSSSEFFKAIAELIDKFGSNKVIAAAKHVEKTNQAYRFVSKERNSFRRCNAGIPKQYKDCWITQDYGKPQKRNIYERIHRCLYNVNLDEVDFNNFIIDKVSPSLFGSEPEEVEQEISEGEHRYFVYAWRWCGDERFAKIGQTRNGLKGVKDRMVTTYHPTDDPVLLGVRECADAKESHKIEQYILNALGRTRSDREWVKIDGKFNEMIDKSFMESQAD